MVGMPVTRHPPYSPGRIGISNAILLQSRRAGTLWVAQNAFYNRHGSQADVCSEHSWENTVWSSRRRTL